MFRPLRTTTPIGHTGSDEHRFGRSGFSGDDKRSHVLTARTMPLNTHDNQPLMSH